MAIDSQLPRDWEAHVQALPGHCILHIPVALRERVAVAMCQELEDLLGGGLLELGRSKLLLSVPPRKVNLCHELELRLRLWAEGKLEELLIRIEEQTRCKAEAKRTRRGGAGARACFLARAGAFSKAVAALTSNMADLSGPEQLRWAKELLPNSGGLADATCLQVDTGGSTSGPDPDFAKLSHDELRKAALGGVRFGA